MLYDRPTFKERYDNYIGGQFVSPVDGEYFDDISPVDGKSFTKVARSNEKDIERALDAAHKGAEEWNKASAQERSSVLLRIADILEDNLEYLARVETIEYGKAIGEPLNADLPLPIEHFRYLWSAVRTVGGTISELDEDTVSIQLPEPPGVVGQIIPWNFPLLMATWKIAPALAAGNCTIVKPAEQTPASIMVLLELV